MGLAAGVDEDVGQTGDADAVAAGVGRMVNREDFRGNAGCGQDGSS